MRKRKFTVSDGKLVLVLTPAEEGGFVVISPFDSALITEAETIEEPLKTLPTQRPACAKPGASWRGNS